MGRKRSRAPHDAEHRASGAVIGRARSAPLARATADIDLADHALPDPVAVTRRGGFHGPDELVTWHTSEAGIAFE